MSGDEEGRPFCTRKGGQLDSRCPYKKEDIVIEGDVPYIPDCFDFHLKEELLRKQ